MTINGWAINQEHQKGKVCDEQWTSEKEKKTSTAASGILYGGSDTRRANKGKRSNDKSSKLIEQHTLYHWSEDEDAK